MIDMHCHILPGLDDGARDMDEAIHMANTAVKEGISTIIATPHHKNGRYDNSKKDVVGNVKVLNEVLMAKGIPLEVLPGQECRIFGEFLEEYESGNIMSLACSHFVLIELPSGHVPRYTERLLYDIQMKGLTPVIAHPERNSELTERPDLLYSLVKNGALSQITAASVCGYFGKSIKKFSQHLIEANLAHLIASDAHNTASRSFCMEEAFQLINAKYGVEMVCLLKENAELLVRGQTVMKEIPERIQKRKFLGLF